MTGECNEVHAIVIWYFTFGTHYSITSLFIYSLFLFLAESLPQDSALFFRYFIYPSLLVSPYAESLLSSSLRFRRLRWEWGVPAPTHSFASGDSAEKKEIYPSLFVYTLRGVPAPLILSLQEIPLRRRDSAFFISSFYLLAHVYFHFTRSPCSSHSIASGDSAGNGSWDLISAISMKRKFFLSCYYLVQNYKILQWDQVISGFFVP